MEHEPRRLLVVEDDDDDFFIVHQMLKENPQPLRVDRAASGQQALQAAAALAYDVFLLDYRLGAQTGLEVLRQLREQEVSAPAIFLTGQGDEDTAVAAMKLGATDYLVKSKLTASGLNRAIAYACALQEKEETIRRARREMEARERRYRDLFERNLAGVFRATAAGVLLECNDSMARMLGYENRSQLTGRELAQMYFETADRVRVMGKLERDGQVVNEEIKLRRADGSPVWVLTNASLRKDDGEVVVEGTTIDITERRQLQEQLLHSQKLEAIGQMAGGIAHDFNNLLMIIGSYSELLAAGVENQPQLRKSAEEVQKAARKATALTRQLLAFSRKQVMSPRLLDLNQVIADNGKLLPRLIGENIHINVVPGQHIWPVKADPVQIDQVLMNLAVNARDAMPKGGQLTLETRAVHLDEEYARTHPGVQPGDYVMLAVSDSGTGIAPEVLPRIFEPFFTTKEVGHGTGLGLPTVYGIVKQSGGSVWVYSEAGRGTVFKIYLPRAIREAAEREYEAPDWGNSRGSETVLLVEDEEALRQVTSDFLRARGYTVLQASGGAEAMETARAFSGTIHVLVTDVVMPGMSGTDLAKELQKISPSTKVLYMSGYTEATVVRHGVGPGTMFLQKPFALIDLAVKVRELLGPVRAVAA